MRQYIAFDVFREGQSLRLTIGRLADVETMTGQPIGNLLRLNQGLNLSALAALLSAGLRDDNGVKPASYYLAEIQKALDAGHTIEEIQGPVFKAVVATGILGKKVYMQVFPEKATKKMQAEAEEEEKN